MGGPRGEFIGRLVAFRRTDGAMRVEVAQHCCDHDLLLDLVLWASGVD